MSVASPSPLTVVHFETSEQKKVVETHVCDWLSELDAIRTKMGTPQELTELFFEGNSDLDVLSDSESVVHLIARSYGNDHHYIGVEDSNGDLQGLGVLNDRCNELKYLATAPRNLPISVNKTAIRGVGRSLVKEAIRISALFENVRLELSPTGSSTKFYAGQGFTQENRLWYYSNCSTK
jgi:hypothetical protein